MFSIYLIFLHIVPDIIVSAANFKDMHFQMERNFTVLFVNFK